MVRWSIMVGSQRVADDLPDRGRVGLRHVRRAVERSCRLAHGLGWQREHLKKVTIKRNEVLLDQGIATRRGIMCSHREPPYRNDPQRHDLRQSELAQDHTIVLPLFAQMTDGQQERVAEVLRTELHA